MLSGWTLAGQPRPDFYNSTHRELVAVCEAAHKRDARQAWLTAQYVRRAFHTPNDMPDDPLTPELTEAQQVEQAREFFKGLADGS